jgi:hypothetical protein
VGFDEAAYRQYFPARQWQTLASGSTIIYGVPTRGGELEQIPAFFSVTRRRAA